MSIPARFKQSDVARALKGAADGGMRVGQVTIELNGNIIMVSETTAAPTHRNKWDQVFAS